MDRQRSGALILQTAGGSAGSRSTNSAGRGLLKTRSALKTVFFFGGGRGDCAPCIRGNDGPQMGQLHAHILEREFFFSFPFVLLLLLLLSSLPLFRIVSSRRCRF